MGQAGRWGVHVTEVLLKKSPKEEKVNKVVSQKEAVWIIWTSGSHKLVWVRLSQSLRFLSWMHSSAHKRRSRRQVEGQQRWVEGSRLGSLCGCKLITGVLRSSPSRPPSECESDYRRVSP